eukprot:gene7564-22014_t
MMIPGTFYHERAHLGQYFGIEKERQYRPLMITMTFKH